MIDRLARRRTMLCKNLPPLKNIFEMAEGAPVLDPQQKLFYETLYDEKSTGLEHLKYDYTDFKRAIEAWDADDLRRFVDLCDEIEGQKDRHGDRAKIMRGHLEEELRLRVSAHKSAAPQPGALRK